MPVLAGLTLERKLNKFYSAHSYKAKDNVGNFKVKIEIFGLEVQP